MESFRFSKNQIIVDKLKELLSENSKILREGLFSKLHGILNKQLSFFRQHNSWELINRNEELLKELHEEQAITQRIEYVLNDITSKINEFIGYEFEKIKREIDRKVEEEKDRKEELKAEVLKELKELKAYADDMFFSGKFKNISTSPSKRISDLKSMVNEAREIIISNEFRELEPLLKGIEISLKDKEELIAQARHKLRLDLIKAQQREKELAAKFGKIRLLECNDYITLDEMKKIVTGELPLFYYHGMIISKFEYVLLSGGLVPKERLDLIISICRLNKRIPEQRKKMKEIFDTKRKNYDKHLTEFKSKVMQNEEIRKRLKERETAIIDIVLKKQKELVKKLKKFESFHELFFGLCTVYYDEYGDSMNIRIHDYTLNNRLVSEMQDMIEYSKPINKDTKIPVVDQNKKGIKECWEQFVENMQRIGKRNKISNQQLLEYANLIWEAVNYDIFAGNLLNMDPILLKLRSQLELIGNMLQMRDPWFILLGADEPFIAKENFERVKNYTYDGYDLLTNEPVGPPGVIFEIKPSFYKKIIWKEVYPWKNVDQQSLEYRSIPAATFGKLTHDLITTDKIDFFYLSHIYTSRENFNNIVNLLKVYGLSNIPVSLIEEQPELFKKAMYEVEQNLRRHGVA